MNSISHTQNFSTEFSKKRKAYSKKDEAQTHLIHFFKSRCSDRYGKLLSDRGEAQAQKDLEELSQRIISAFNNCLLSGVVNFFSEYDNFPIRVLFNEQNAKCLVIKNSKEKRWIIILNKVKNLNLIDSIYDGYDVLTGKSLVYTKYKHLHYPLIPQDGGFQRVKNPIRFYYNSYFDQVHSEDSSILHYQFQLDPSSLPKYLESPKNIQKIVDATVLHGEWFPNRCYKKNARSLGEVKTSELFYNAATEIAFSFDKARSKQTFVEFLEQHPWERYLYRLMVPLDQSKAMPFLTPIFHDFMRENSGFVIYSKTDQPTQSLALTLLSWVKKIHPHWYESEAVQPCLKDFASTAAAALIQQNPPANSLARLSKWNNSILHLLFGSCRLKGITIKEGENTPPISIIRLKPFACGENNKLYEAIVDNALRIYRKPFDRKIHKQEMHPTIQEAGIPYTIPLHHFISFKDRDGVLSYREIISLCTGSLSEIKQLTYEQKLKIIKQISIFLMEMHLKGFYHGDIKSGNIFLVRKDDEYDVCVGDFDLSGKGTAFPPPLTVGDGRYSSPDFLLVESSQLRADQCDLWSLGVVIYELKHPKRPLFPHSPQELMNMPRETIRQEYFQFISSVQHILDKDNPLDALILDLIQLDPNKRPSAKEVSERISHLQPDHFTPHLKESLGGIVNVGAALLSFEGSSVTYALNPPSEEPHQEPEESQVVRSNFTPPSGYLIFRK
jgi:hypothetical protein